MSTPVGDVFFPDHALIPLHSFTIDVGVATRIYTFNVPQRYQIVELQSCAAAADATDKVTVSLVNVTTSDTIITGTVVNAIDTPIRVTAVDSAKSDIMSKDHKFKLTATFAGTAANVKGVHATLWVKVAR